MVQSCHWWALLLAALAVSAVRPNPKDPAEDLDLSELTSGLTPKCQAEMKGILIDFMSRCEPWCKTWCSSGTSTEWWCKSEVKNLILGHPSLHQWFISLATTKKESVLWSGFSEGGEAERTSIEALLHFAEFLNKEPVTPSTELGKIIYEHGDFQMCYKDPKAQELLFHFWNKASRAFVEGMAQKQQSSVVMFINKDTNPEVERNLYHSVLWNYELPSLGSEVKETLLPGSSVRPWQPQLIIVDLRGTCKALRSLIPKQLGVSSLIKEWLEDKPIFCIECVSPCKLNQDFAEELRKKVGL